MGINKTLPCHFPLGVDFILRGRDTLQIIGIMVFLFRIKVAVITDKLTQAFFHFRPTQNKVVVGRNTVSVNGDSFARIPYIALRAVWKINKEPTRAVFLFEKFNVAFFILLLLELVVDTIFSMLNAVPFYKDGIYILL